MGQPFALILWWRFRRCCFLGAKFWPVSLLFLLSSPFWDPPLTGGQQDLWFTQSWSAFRAGWLWRQWRAPPLARSGGSRPAAARRRWGPGQRVSFPAMEVYGAVRNRAQPSGERDPHPSSAVIPWAGPPAFTSSSLALRSCGSCPPSERVARVPSLLSGLCQSCFWKHCWAKS